MFASLICKKDKQKAIEWIEVTYTHGGPHYSLCINLWHHSHTWQLIYIDLFIDLFGFDIFHVCFVSKQVIKRGKNK